MKTAAYRCCSAVGMHGARSTSCGRRAAKGRALSLAEGKETRELGEAREKRAGQGGRIGLLALTASHRYRRHVTPCTKHATKRTKRPGRGIGVCAACHRPRQLRRRCGGRGRRQAASAPPHDLVAALLPHVTWRVPSATRSRQVENQPPRGPERAFATGGSAFDGSAAGRRREGQARDSVRECARRERGACQQRV